MPATVEAREVVEFTDGRYLEIRSYRVEGDLIRLDVDRGSFMIIPVASIDEIRRDRDVVFSSNRVRTRGVRTARAAHGLAPSDRVGSEVSPRVGTTLASIGS
jgi:hypothetical protein